MANKEKIISVLNNYTAQKNLKNKNLLELCIIFRSEYGISQDFVDNYSNLAEEVSEYISNKGEIL